VTLEKMYAGDTWLGQNKNINENSPVVDEVGKITNVTCTIFQRMNEAGDMLRVSTNVKTLEGSRRSEHSYPVRTPTALRIPS
jgi:methyl-accepting chemotaxis protein